MSRGLGDVYKRQNGVRSGESRGPGLESHRKEFRFHSDCRGKPLGGFKHRSGVVLFILLKITHMAV